MANVPDFKYIFDVSRTEEERKEISRQAFFKLIGFVAFCIFLESV
jgi:Family of unknown function (DUF5310)